MTMIDPTMDWSEIINVLMFDLDEIMSSNGEYIENSYSRVSHIFNNTWICRYPSQQNAVFDNGSEFKRDFIPLLKYLDIKPVLTTIKNPQYNALAEPVRQLIFNMIATKNPDKSI